MSATFAAQPLQLLETVAPSVARFVGGIERLPPERKVLLEEAAGLVAQQLAANHSASLTFICTHNSRRSHLAQIWAQVAAEYYGLEGVETYSGGIEATACNIRTVQALRRSGLQVVATTEGDNPKYLVQYADNRPAIAAYSKLYSDSANPQEDYLAMMCCSDVDEKCPVVVGATARIPLHYVDPKAADDTPAEAETYDNKCKEIAREMFYLFSRVEKTDVQ